MPAKGQTCLNCDASCCERIVAYRLLDGVKLEKPLKRYSVKELRSLGLIEISSESDGTCPVLTEDRLCKLEHHKPRLCRTYWCYGRLWKPRRG